MDHHRFYEANRAHLLSEPLLRMVQLHEKLPAIKRSRLRRAPGRSRPDKKKVRGKLAHLPPDRPLTWHRFP